MKKITIFFMAIACLVPITGAFAAVAVKKAAPVATNKSSGSDGATSLVPSVIGLVSGVIEMNAKQKALTSDCIPTKAEMNFVDNTIKEWAKTGQVTRDAVKKTLGREPCPGSDCYAADVLSASGAQGVIMHYNNFNGPGNDGTVWYAFPKTGIGTYCKDGMPTCSDKNKVTLSDTYDIFNLVDFGPADYTQSEATMAAKLLNKVESCSTAKLNSKKKAMWGEFLVNTASGVGQKTNTGTIMEQVGGITSGGVGGAMGSLGSVATQFMNK